MCVGSVPDMPPRDSQVSRVFWKSAVGIVSHSHSASLRGYGGPSSTVPDHVPSHSDSVMLGWLEQGILLWY